MGKTRREKTKLSVITCVTGRFAPPVEVGEKITSAENRAFSTSSFLALTFKFTRLSHVMDFYSFFPFSCEWILSIASIQDTRSGWKRVSDWKTIATGKLDFENRLETSPGKAKKWMSQVIRHTYYFISCLVKMILRATIPLADAKSQWKLETEISSPLHIVW